MVPVFAVLFVLTVSLVIVRFATVGLTMTGLSKDLAQFQALSAFTRSGFTTQESESIVNHPVRRRIIMHLMLLGNAGIVIAIATVMQMVIMAGDDWGALWLRLLELMAGVVLLWILASSQMVEQFMWRMHAWALTRWAHLELQDYIKLLRIAHEYAIFEIRVHEDDWLAGRTLQQLQLSR